MPLSDDTPRPWLSIVGIGEDGLEGLSETARDLLSRAELVAGGRRHLTLVASLGKATLEWDTPFSASIPKLLAHRGKRVVALCSGDPFWYGAGSTFAEAVPPDETVAIPAPSTFAWAAARLRWRLEETVTLGLHARPIELLRPLLRTGARLIVLVRDGVATAQVAAYLNANGFGPSRLTILEALGGPRERVRTATAANFACDDVTSPVALALEAVAAEGSAGIPCVAGLPDDLFVHDGQLTKREIRAVTLSTLAPRGGELLWDIGAGAGSIGIEWLLAHPTNRAIGIEAREDRLNTARSNAQSLGVPHFDLRLGTAPDALKDLPTPDAVFVGGGASRDGVLDAIWQALPTGGRLVVNSVTLETEAVLITRQACHGGTLLRLTVERAGAVGNRTGWRAAMPVVQWSVTK
ncbi:MAG: precorrin-6y C5,15-methyltransferase (decarboxylating) subunit CbiE [Bradyrhizobium sp.]|uniref:precorrin-6y C5,15-methyltransferase (decarboxylating) subunit CbiE n=1 Tax=Bradyrhizobium sp. TaxID=376 RepID=UPI001C2A1EE6|nr:precorrin-6y C5,15-methyltransferase (decarboxylating) subunit CbiE [Bradyrhizobium sp.]MBU6462005.1 precorrin-6y C5,15-methyltransferase (decarboxylating) subunit CbiE [Pseudomonadota bacterium]MDE2066102.1 precorrin-6y C5,15-methyltransferase (decarboxylating) subunit CbiE [Bradyrhizobium sp.]MDE2240990.1 precorrin-6y C5,15-methyltransferase (decarboxylating) subunit CbiE [Bradyrhizobium sp.]MDE2472739.1 precorrin-6y C5,15-methyltransferase (decarboxylating) subunit CbiE [Bradyrhizobium sp